MYHKIILVGNLGRDPEMRYTPSGQQVTSFSMATSEKWNGQDGQTQERTIWWRITVWGKQAEICNQYLKKGKQVLVEGRMTPDPKTGTPKIFTRQDGTPAAAYEVTALPNGVKFLGSRGGNGHAEDDGGAGDIGAGSESDLPADDGSGDIPF